MLLPRTSSGECVAAAHAVAAMAAVEERKQADSHPSPDVDPNTASPMDTRDRGGIPWGTVRTQFLVASFSACTTRFHSASCVGQSVTMPFSEVDDTMSCDVSFTTCPASVSSATSAWTWLRMRATRLGTTLRTEWAIFMTDNLDVFEIEGVNSRLWPQMGCTRSLTLAARRLQPFLRVSTPLRCRERELLPFPSNLEAPH